MSDRPARLSLSQQLGYGFIGVLMVSLAAMYCAGIASFFVRPLLLQRAPTPTIFIPPTLAPTPTQAKPTFIQLPPATLLATPTQGRIPTREPATATPTADWNSTPTITATNGALRGTPSPTARASATR